VPVSAPLVRLYSEYLHVEYGGTDSAREFNERLIARMQRRAARASKEGDRKALKEYLEEDYE